MFWFVVNAVKSEHSVRSILHAFSLGLVLLALVETFYFFEQGADPFSMKIRAGTLTGSSQWLSCFLVIGLPIIWMHAFGEGSGWIRSLYLCALAISGVALFLVHTRAAWLAVMAQGLFYGMFKLTRNWVASSLSVVAFVALLILFIALPQESGELISGNPFTNSRSMLLRLNTWEFAANDIRQYPLAGIGFGKHSFQLKHPDLDARLHTHVHNYFLSTAVQIGIPGLLIILLVFGGVLRHSARWSNRFSHHYTGKLAFAFFLVTIGLLVRLQFDDMFIGSLVYLYMLLSGLVFRLGMEEQSHQKMGG